MDFDPNTKTHDELRDFFKVPKGKTMDADMTEKMLHKTEQAVKTRQLQFYAFLNKQFNVMNYKSARCSMHCFDSTSVAMA
jgi:hypothetical protein